MLGFWLNPGNFPRTRSLDNGPHATLDAGPGTDTTKARGAAGGAMQSPAGRGNAGKITNSETLDAKP
ncbi:hypothetical protein ACFVYT_27690 [Streptomyces sp. NPDC058290]|uniref:hypothetical protein n=1 Tax=Streptomyces sp. NPDC058290 TaxID=3346426 RepID=UPI0036F010BF